MARRGKPGRRWTPWALAAIVVFVACDDVDSHIYAGQQYDPALGCVNVAVGLDVISGGTTSNGCAPECLVFDADGGQTIFVSSECPPFPPGFATQSEDAGDASALCPAAIQAFLDGGVCQPTSDDGGDGGDDATVDAEADGGTEAMAPEASTGPGEAGADAAPE